MMKFLMLSCHKATLLTEEKLAGGHLPFVRKLQLHFHLKMCDGCRRFAQQSAAIEQAFRKKLASDEEPTHLDGDREGSILSPEMREKLLDRLRSGQ